jgi:hypothetical protein
VPSAQLALATILQACTGVSDDEVIEATVMDRRWQLVLDCMDAEAPPFAKGTLAGFRKRLIGRDLDRRLVENDTVTQPGQEDRGSRWPKAGTPGPASGPLGPGQYRGRPRSSSSAR